MKDTKLSTPSRHRRAEQVDPTLTGSVAAVDKTVQAPLAAAGVSSAAQATAVAAALAEGDILAQQRLAVALEDAARAADRRLAAALRSAKLSADRRMATALAEADLSADRRVLVVIRETNRAADQRIAAAAKVADEALAEALQRGESLERKLQEATRWREVRLKTLLQ